MGQSFLRERVVENSYRRFISVNLIGLFVSSVLFVWLSRSGTIDFWVSQQFFDPVTQTFPLEHNKRLFYWGHQVLKKLSVIAWLVCIGLALAGVWSQRLRTWRRPLLVFIAMGGAVSLVIQMLKGSSMHACPYDLAMYGGKSVWFPLFDTVKMAVRQGRCWPGGHASAGFVLIAGYFALRDRAPRWARGILIGSLVLGTVMSAVQVVRGAHFVSHNLWSLWISWAVCVAISMVIEGFRYVRLANVKTGLANQCG